LTTSTKKNDTTTIHGSKLPVNHTGEAKEVVELLSSSDEEEISVSVLC
jgi:hypothetical protein